MALSVKQQDQLRAALERATLACFRKQAKIITNGPMQIDATGLLVVLAQWVADLIKGAPEEMRDDLFLSFADTVVTLAGIKAEEEAEQPETLQ